MFGFLYGLFMGGACIADSFNSMNEDDIARRKSIEKNGWCIGRKNRYYKGEPAYKEYRNGHEYAINKKTGKIIEDLTDKFNKDQNDKCKNKFNKEVNIAKEKGEDHFYFIPYPKDCDFAIEHPSGYYETDTLKLFYVYTIRGVHYKTYSRKMEYGFGKYSYLPDIENGSKLTKEEWIKYRGCEMPL